MAALGARELGQDEGIETPLEQRKGHKRCSGMRKRTDHVPHDAIRCPPRGQHRRWRAAAPSKGTRQASNGRSMGQIGNIAQAVSVRFGCEVAVAEGQSTERPADTHLASPDAEEANASASAAAPVCLSRAPISRLQRRNRSTQSN